MSSRLPRDEALEKEDRIDEMKKKKNKKKTKKKKQPIPHLLQVQQAPAIPLCQSSTGSYPAPSPDPTTHLEKSFPKK